MFSYLLQSYTTHMPLAFNYIHAGSPTVTNLTFDNKSRTFTCTSTGGPATTVTWRRDGVVITLNATYQQTKRVVDPVNGTYQTALIIDPSVGQIVGTYNCTVENDRGKSSQTVVVPGETRTPLFSIYATVTYIEVHTQLWCSKFCKFMRIPKHNESSLFMVGTLPTESIVQNEPSSSLFR